MKKVTIVLLALFVLASLALAEDATPKSKQGDEALLFSFAGLSNLNAGSYAGGIGGKYYFQDDMALRAGLMFDWNSSTQKDNSGGGLPDEKMSSMTLGLMPAITYNLPPVARFLFMLAVQHHFLGQAAQQKILTMLQIPK